ncbi:MAG TPA: response regulator [Steroidobacteraceae bacterium]
MPQTSADPLDLFFTALTTKRVRSARRGVATCAVAAAVRARRIVVADDNQDMADSLRMLLELDGHVVYTTHDGAGAIYLAQSMKPDFLLLDIGMPKLNGYDVARHIRSQPWGRAMRLVAITGWGQPEDRSRALKAGFDYHLTKPVPLEALADVLNSNGVYALLADRGLAY